MATYEDVQSEVVTFEKANGKKPRCIVVGDLDYSEILHRAGFANTLARPKGGDVIGGVKLWIVPGRGFLILGKEEYVDMLDNSRRIYP